MCFTKVFRTELGHKYILVECSVIALCLPVMSKLPVINSCAINRTMIGMSIKRISVLDLCHVLKPFVKSTPGHLLFALRDLSEAYYTRGAICKFKLILSILARQMAQVVLWFMIVT